jgi:hypothetical protein
MDEIAGGDHRPDQAAPSFETEQFSPDERKMSRSAAVCPHRELLEAERGR